MIVSEENGKVSVAYGGELYTSLTQEGLREKLEIVRDRPLEENSKTRKVVFRGQRGDKLADKKADA